MTSPQALSEAARREVAMWAADCAEHVLPLFEAEALTDDRPRDAIARARAFGRGDLDAVGEIRRRFVAVRAAPNHPHAVHDEVTWQLGQMTARTRAALRQLPPLGEDPAGPLGAGLLASGVLASVIREIQADVAGS